MNEMIMNGLKGLASGFDKLDAATNGWQDVLLWERRLSRCL